MGSPTLLVRLALTFTDGSTADVVSSLDGPNKWEVRACLCARFAGLLACAALEVLAWLARVPACMRCLHGFRGEAGGDCRGRACARDASVWVAVMVVMVVVATAATAATAVVVATTTVIIIE